VFPVMLDSSDTKLADWLAKTGAILSSAEVPSLLYPIIKALPLLQLETKALSLLLSLLSDFLRAGRFLPRPLLTVSNSLAATVTAFFSPLIYVG